MSQVRTFSPGAKILFSLRDFMVAWHTEGLGGRNRVLTLVEHLASRAPEERIHALLFEEPDGDNFPWEFSEPVAVVRRIMDAYGWTDGHWMPHLHKKVRAYVWVAVLLPVSIAAAAATAAAAAAAAAAAVAFAAACCCFCRCLLLPLNRHAPVSGRRVRRT